MSICKIQDDKFVKIDNVSFQSVELLERQHIQKFLCNDISVISDDLFVICEEFHAWKESDRRIDILCIDRDGKFVVMELKRGKSKQMELQSIRYKALIEHMELSFDQAVKVHQDFLRDFSKLDVSEEDAKHAIFEFLQRDEVTAREIFGKGKANIILVSPEFSRELIITVDSQISKGDNIRCIRIEPYKLSNDEIIVDFDEVNITYEISVINATDRKVDLYGYYKGYDLKINEVEYPNLAMWGVIRDTIEHLVKTGTDPAVINKEFGKFGYNNDILFGVDGEINKMTDFHKKAREDAQLANSKFWLNSYLCYYEYDHYLIPDKKNKRTYVVYMIENEEDFENVMDKLKQLRPDIKIEYSVATLKDQQ